MRTSALLRKIRNVRICMGKKPIVSVTYESCFFYWNPFIFVGYRNVRFFSHINPYISNVTQECRCSPMLIFRTWATCVTHRLDSFVLFMKLRSWKMPLNTLKFFSTLPSKVELIWLLVKVSVMKIDIPLSELYKTLLDSTRREENWNLLCM